MSLTPVSAVIPTLGRRARLLRTVSSLLQQSSVPAEIIIVDASSQPVTLDELRRVGGEASAAPSIVVQGAKVRGAAAQRNQALESATQPLVLFLDDDVDLEPGCIAALVTAMSGDLHMGGCAASITNQSYHPPGKAMRPILALLGCPREGSLAGTIAGPALNFLPESGGTRSNSAEWLNTTCTLYRHEALPKPPFLAFFFGYSLMEDVALSVQVSHSWRLAAVPAARVYHDSQPASYKDRTFRRERMEFVNRWFVMTRVVGRRSIEWKLRLVAHQFLMVALSLRDTHRWPRLPAALGAKFAGMADVYLRGSAWRGYETSDNS